MRSAARILSIVFSQDCFRSNLSNETSIPTRDTATSPFRNAWSGKADIEDPGTRLRRGSKRQPVNGLWAGAGLEWDRRQTANCFFCPEHGESSRTDGGLGRANRISGSQHGSRGRHRNTPALCANGFAGGHHSQRHRGRKQPARRDSHLDPAQRGRWTCLCRRPGTGCDRWILRRKGRQLTNGQPPHGGTNRGGRVSGTHCANFCFRRGRTEIAGEAS